MKKKDRKINILVPMAGRGSRFEQSGYTFPKPLVDIKGKPMIEIVARNLRPDCAHRFIFIAQREHCQKYDVYNVLKAATDNNFELIQINGQTEGAACTALTAVQYIDNDDDLIIANSDQHIGIDIDNFIEDARGSKDGLIMTFSSSHPKWSYARVDAHDRVLEVAEKKVISPHATVGVYYFGRGSDFVRAAQSMIHKDIRHNGEFYVSPVYNELIIAGKNVFVHQIPQSAMHGLGTPEDLNIFLEQLNKHEITL